MKYKIQLGGRGCDIWIHEITEEQKQILKEGNVEVDQMDYDEIAEVLNRDSVDDIDISYTGVYNRLDSIVIEVKDENDNLVFDSTKTEGWYFDNDTLMEYEDFDSVHQEENKLLVESYSKGNFFNFELETEEFDPKKLSPKVVEVGEAIEIITGLYYEGVELEYEYDDYWGKGYYYHLT